MRINWTWMKMRATSRCRHTWMTGDRASGAKACSRCGAEQTPDIAAVVRGLLAEFPTDATGHITDCGYDDNDGTCGCYSLPQRLRDALAAVLAAAVREARAAELREAADDLTQLAVMEFDARPNAPRGAAIWDSAQWLKDRADRIAVDAPEGGEGR